VAILFGHAFRLPPLLAAVAELRERVRAELHHLQKAVGSLTRALFLH